MTIEKGHEIKVLDHGHVRLVDFMGSDEDIVSAARISTGRGFVSWNPYRRCKKCDGVSGLEPSLADVLNHALGLVTKCDHDWQDFPRGDLGILDYLYRMEHTSPFEMAEIILDVQVPMDHWRQWIRNRTANVNEYSTRYSEAIDFVAATAPDKWRTQGVTNRQGSGAYLDEASGQILSEREVALHKISREVYDERLRNGVAKEQARKDLPLSTYTAARWKIDLHNLLKHFLGKRLHPHAQEEIRVYAGAVAEIVKAIWPRTYTLFEEYDLYGVRLSRSEARMLAGGMRGARTADGSLSESMPDIYKKIGGA